MQRLRQQQNLFMRSSLTMEKQKKFLLSFVKSILLTFVFMVIVDVVMYLKLERINMAESLKSVE